MKLDVTEEQGVTIVRGSEKLDAMTSPNFQDSINKVLEENVSRLIVDLSDVPFVSSAGLRVFVVMAKRLKGQGELAVTGLSENIKEVFQLAGFDRLMSLCPDIETAKQQLKATSEADQDR